MRDWIFVIKKYGRRKSLENARVRDILDSPLRFETLRLKGCNVFKP